jgi:hypothetical protein
MHRFAQPFSDFAPGVCYLLYSLVLLELGIWLKGRSKSEAPHDLALHLAYAFLGLFLTRHLLVHLQSELSLGPLPVRAYIAVFGFGGLAYWARYAPDGAEWSRANTSLRPFLVETMLAFATLTLALELRPTWHPIAWSAIALLLLTQTQARGWPIRLLHYSWLFDLASIVQLAATTSQVTSPLQRWYTDSRLLSVAAMVLQFVYVGVAYRGRYLQSPVAFPRGLGAMQRWHEKLLGRHLNSSVLYPLVFGVALFLYWRFDRAILTLLWVVEILGVFCLGTFLKEKHFLQVALAALAACVVRLVFFDLSQTDVAVRALVFVAVGAIMLLINALFKKYRDRFSQ